MKNNLSEEEKKIIKSLKWSQQQMRLGNLPDYNQSHYADVQGLLDLYTKEKEKNKEIKTKLEEKNIPIDTLLAEFERLENKEDELDELLYDSLQIKLQYELLTRKINVISKSKIQHKIQELREEQKETNDFYFVQGEINVLKSLL